MYNKDRAIFGSVEKDIFDLAKAKAREKDYSDLVLPTEREKETVKAFKEEIDKTKLALENVINWERPLLKW